MNTTRYGATHEEIAGLLGDEPRYRVDQVWEGLYHGLRSPAEMTNVPRRLRDDIDRLLPQRAEHGHRIRVGRR